MVPYSRNPPWGPQDAPPRNCVDCRISANFLLAKGEVRLERNGFVGWGGEKKWYRRRTITATYSSHETGGEPGEYTDKTGSITLVYERTLSGETRLVSASGTWIYDHLDRIPIYSPDPPFGIIGYEDHPTYQTSAVGYNAAGGSGLGGYSWSGDAIVPSNFGQIPSAPGTVSDAGNERTWSESLPGGSWTTSEKLEEEYTTSLLVENAEALLAAIDLADVSPNGEGWSARYGGVGPFRSQAAFDAAIDAAEDAVDLAQEEVNSATSAVSVAEGALDAATLSVTAARQAVRPAFISAMQARDALEALLVRIETAKRREDAAALAAAEGDLEEATEEWETARGAWEAQQHDLSVAIDAERLSRSMLAQAIYFRELAARAALNAEHNVSIAEANKEKAAEWDQILVEPGGTSDYPGRILERDEEGNVTAVTLVKEVFQTYWQHPSSWSRPPEKIAVDWRLALIAGETVIHTATATEEVSLSSDTFFATGTKHDIDVPDQEGIVVIAGLPSRGTILWNPEFRGGAARKMGFLAYDGSPRYFLRETAGGSFPGCTVQSLPAKIYSGAQSYDPLPNELDNWQGGEPPGAVNESFSGDVPATRRSLLASVDPYRGGTGTPAHEEFLDRGEVLSATQRRWVSQMRCGENEIQDVQTLTLSQEFTTAALRNLVDPVCDQPFGETPELYAPEPFSIFANFAIRWLSPAADYYARVRLRGAFQWIPPAGSSGFFGVPATLAMEWQRIEHDLDTGSRTETVENVTLVDGISEALTLDAASGEAIEVGAAKLSADHPTMWDLPMWRPVCEEAS